MSHPSKDPNYEYRGAGVYAPKPGANDPAVQKEAQRLIAENHARQRDVKETRRREQKRGAL